MDTIPVKSGYSFYSLADENKPEQDYYVMRCDCGNCDQSIAVFTFFHKKLIGSNTVLANGMLPNFCPFCGNHLDKFDFSENL